MVKQDELGGILVVFSETTQPMDDSKMFNNIYKKDGANTNKCLICWAVKICNQPTTSV